MTTEGEDIVADAEAIVSKLSVEMNVTDPIEAGMCTVRTAGIKCPNKAEGFLVFQGVATSASCVDHAVKILREFGEKGWCFRS